MKGAFRQSMSWLHTWAGLAIGWVLYFMFITGTVGYFDNEIDHWMQPEIPAVSTALDQSRLLAIAEQRLAEVAADASSWFVSLPTPRNQHLIIEWQKNSDDEWQEEALNPQTGQPVIARKTGGGQRLYRMHYALHYLPRVLAYYLTSLSAMFMLVALVTGIIIHKKIFKDFFTFRPGKKQRSWLDMHNVLSVLPLPFHIMITYSGLIFLMFTTMPAVITATYGTDEGSRDRFLDAVFVEDAAKKPAGIAAANISLSSLLTNAETHWGKNKIAYISIENQGDINARIELQQQDYNGIDDGQSLTYSAVNGELQQTGPVGDEPSGAVKFYEVMINLHEGQFAGVIVRCLYFLSGLMGSGMIATGMILWAVKRREKARKKGLPSKGLVLVEYLNVGTIVGLPIGIAIYFWANRLIPVGFEGRASWEANSLFISWAVMLTYPLLFAGKRPLIKIWIDQLILAAALYGLLPVVNAITTDKHLAATLQQGDWIMAGFEISMLAFSLCFGFTAYLLQRKIHNNQVAKSSAHLITTYPSSKKATIDVSAL